jgi:hypothetical protein
MEYQTKQIGSETRATNIKSLIQKDQQPIDFLRDSHLDRVDAAMREEAALTILQFGI